MKGAHYECMDLKSAASLLSHLTVPACVITAISSNGFTASSHQVGSWMRPLWLCFVRVAPNDHKAGSARHTPFFGSDRRHPVCIALPAVSASLMQIICVRSRAVELKKGSLNISLKCMMGGVGNVLFAGARV